MGFSQYIAAEISFPTPIPTPTPTRRAPTYRCFVLSIYKQLPNGGEATDWIMIEVTLFSKWLHIQIAYPASPLQHIGKTIEKKHGFVGARRVVQA